MASAHSVVAVIGKITLAAPAVGGTRSPGIRSEGQQATTEGFSREAVGEAAWNT
jgi:hypothetical protein